MSLRGCVVSVVAILGLAVAGCSSDHAPASGVDAGTMRADSGGIRTDGGGTTPTDGGGMTPGDGGGMTPGDGGGMMRRDGAIGPRSDGGGGPTVMGSTGAACATPADCTMLTTAMCLTDLGGYYMFPGGYCTASCTTDGDCGAGGGCMMIPFVGGYCIKACDTEADCRADEGYTCMAPPLGGMAGMFCLPPFMMTGLGDGGLPIP